MFSFVYRVMQKYISYFPKKLVADVLLTFWYLKTRVCSGDGVTGDGGYGNVTSDKIITGEVTGEGMVTGEAFLTREIEKKHVLPSA